MLFVPGQVGYAQTLVRDINRTAPSSYVKQLVSHNGLLFFSTGPVWVSDGTPTGTRTIGELVDARPIGRFHDWLFYQTRHAHQDFRVWSTDGTTTTFLGSYAFPLSAAGVTPRGLALEGAIAGHWVSDGLSMTRVLWQGPRTSGTYFQGPDLAFYVSSWGPARTLQRADGTVAGTAVVDLNGVEPHGQFGGFLGPYLILVGSDKTHGEEVWRVDFLGENLERLSDLNPDSAENGLIKAFVVSGERAFFIAAGPGEHDSLFITDGTRLGTGLVRELPGISSDDFGNLMASDHGVYFSVDVPSVGSELWHSDGTQAGTKLVADVRPGRDGSHPTGLIHHDGRLFFKADDGQTGPELWVSDGTSAGTKLVVDLVPGTAGSRPGETPGFAGPYDSVVATDHELYFVAFTPEDGHEIRRLDFSTGAVSLVFDTNLGRSQSSGPSTFVAVSGLVYFSAVDGMRSRELWQTDGTPEGTMAVREVLFSERWWASKPWSLVPGALLSDETLGFLEVDGSPNGVRPILHDDQIAQAMFAANSAVFVSKGEMFATAGTWSVPSLPIRGVTGGSAGREPTLLGVAGDYVVYRATDDNGALRLWSTSRGQAQPIGRLESIPGVPPVRALAESGDLLYYNPGGSERASLMQTDGTAEGTKEVWRGEDVGLVQITPFNNGVLLLDANHRPWYWDSVTTEAAMLAPVWLPFGSPRAEFQLAGGQAYFPATATNGSIWRTDGTPDGTFQVADSLGHTWFIGSVGETPVFARQDEEYGWEPWTLNGESVRLVGDLNPGSSGSSVREVVQLGDKVVFGADIPPFGFELWSLPVDRFEIPAPSQPEMVHEGFGTPYPNPSVSMITIPLGGLEDAGPIKVAAYDILGRRRALLLDGRPEGSFLRFSVVDWPMGTYFVRAENQGLVHYARFVVMR